ncbi:MAG: carboxypeptidase-like regulatory domain-containing protein [Prevotellaceae bacterium]|nr:carboxypeptidase-like regulatory domain-containing protein [Prevotellaceae bacterium]
MRLIAIACLLLSSLGAKAQRITESFGNIPVVEALERLGSQSGKYRLQFIVSDLEGLSVQADVRASNTAEAVRQLCVGLPLRVTVDGRNIYVERLPDKSSGIAGRLVDSHGQAVDFAAVALLSLRDSAIITGVLSDEDGGFVLTPDTVCPCKLRVSALGFTTRFVDIPDGVTDLGEIALKRDAMMMEQVEVNASNIVHLREKDIIYITREMRKGSYDTGELLGKVPGMTYNRVTGDLRYQGQTKILILIDSLEYDASYIKQLHHARFDKIEVTPFPKGKYSDYDVLINLCRKENYEGWENNGTAHVTVYPNKDNARQDKHLSEFNAFQSFTYTRNKWNFFVDYEPFLEREDLNSTSTTEYTLNHYAEEVIDNPDGKRNKNQREWHGTVRGCLDYQFDKHNSVSLFYLFYNVKKRELQDNTVVQTYLDNENLPSAPGDTIGSTSTSTYKSPTHRLAGFYRGQTNAWNYTVTLNYSHYTDRTGYDLAKTSGYVNLDNRNARMDHTFGKLEVNRRFLDEKIYYALGYDDLWKHYLQSRSETGEALSNYALKQSTVWTYASYNMTDKASLSLLASVTTNHTKGDEASDRYLSWVGKLTYFQKMKAEQWMSLFYSCDVYNPDLQRVTSYGYFSDSLTWQSGNPQLRSSVSHWAIGRYHFLRCLTLELSDNYQPRTFTNITSLSYGLLQDGSTLSYYSSTMPQNAKWNKVNVKLSLDKKIKNLTLSAYVSYWHESGKYQGFKHSANGWECEAYADYYIEKWDLVPAIYYSGGNERGAWAQGWTHNEYDHWHVDLIKTFLHGKLRVGAVYVPPIHFNCGKNASETVTPATVAHFDNLSHNKLMDHHVEIYFHYRLSGGKSVRQYNREMSEER